MGSISVIWVILGMYLLGIGSWFINTHNDMVFLEELCKNTLSQITVYQDSKWVIIENLSNMLNKCSEHKFSTFTGVLEKSDCPTVEYIEQAEKKLKTALKEITQTVEAYPELKANEIYLDSMMMLNNYENNLRESKLIFNELVNRYNMKLSTLPHGFLFKSIDYKTKDYLEL